MKNFAKLIMVFVVSWSAGLQAPFNPVPCTGKEPDGVICVKGTLKRDEKVFKSQEAADAFKAVMEQMEASDVKLEKRAK